MTKRERWAIFSVILIALLVAVSYLSLANPSTALYAQISFSKVGQGTLISPAADNANNETLSNIYVNLTMKITFPQGLDPSRLVLILESPEGQEVSLGNGINLPAANLTYSASSYPHWLVNLPKLSASAYSADVTNPDGSIVGGYSNCPPAAGCTWVNGDSVIRSGAIVTLVFPESVSSPQGYVFKAIYRNSLSGSSINLSLT
jgi:hypothetical protein